ncbi:hypothetical protein NDU88_002276 [Pleurodeles waltl]|uniref:Uncharacterized protein n=1 Tax=Pleurodeles waltl TaxID=8319 RepID=A0AAV7LDS1_PLEWA|nr:hypothetical protein NDU88_002276 [Pleurodeles waltl]
MSPQDVCTSSRRPGSQCLHRRKAQSPRGVLAPRCLLLRASTPGPAGGPAPPHQRRAHQRGPATGLPFRRSESPPGPRRTSAAFWHPFRLRARRRSEAAGCRHHHPPVPAGEMRPATTASELGAPSKCRLPAPDSTAHSAGTLQASQDGVGCLFMA